MSRNQIETYLCFQYRSNICKKISKLIVNKKWDIYLSLPYLTSNWPTFLVDMKFDWKELYTAHNRWFSYNQIRIWNVSGTESSFKISYHPSGFAQFSGTKNIKSGLNTDGTPKWFSVNACSFQNMCAWPFLGASFEWNMNLFQKFDFFPWKQYTILPICKRGKVIQNIDMINLETNMNLEIFLRKVDGADFIHHGTIWRESNCRDITGSFFHPDEGEFLARIFPFQSEWVRYLLLVRLLIDGYWPNSNNKYIETDIAYSYTVANQFLWDNQWKTIRCFHWFYWADFFDKKINKSIDICDV